MFRGASCCNKGVDEDLEHMLAGRNHSCIRQISYIPVAGGYLDIQEAYCPSQGGAPLHGRDREMCCIFVRCSHVDIPESYCACEDGAPFRGCDGETCFVSADYILRSGRHVCVYWGALGQCRG